MSATPACYREYLPCAALRSRVRSFFTFAIGVDDTYTRPAARTNPRLEVIRGSGDPCWSNLLADVHSSLVCCVSGSYSIDGLWNPSTPHSHVIGPISRWRKTAPSGPLMQIGAYFAPNAVAEFFEPGLADRVVALESMWGADAMQLDEQMNRAKTDAERISVFEKLLLQRLGSSRQHQIGLDLAGLTRWIAGKKGKASVEAMADLTGVSRQYLTRVFQDQIGIGPKLFCRLTRFRELMTASSNPGVNWAETAARLGYADQSHMIAEFREFSGSTPASLVQARTFHPFRYDSTRHRAE